MNLLNKKGDIFTLELTQEEFILLNNSLNEILNGMNAIEENLFHTMTGTNHIDAINILSEMQRILK